LPGIKAVVIIISTSLHYFKNNSFSFYINSGLISFAYPPTPSPLSFIFISKNSPPRLCTYSLTAGLVSKHLTIAPRLLAVAIALNPATPPPIIKILAGGNLPAAVIYPPKNLLNKLLANTTALYPAILAIELKTSNTYAFEILGI
jgi:hypothetical protein